MNAHDIEPESTTLGRAAAELAAAQLGMSRVAVMNAAQRADYVKSELVRNLFRGWKVSSMSVARWMEHQGFDGWRLPL